MQFPLVTLTICTFNGEKYLRTTLDSVTKVAYENLEILIVDDGSSDGTRSILNEFAGCDGRVRLLFQHNKGLAAARNRAFCEASGEWIAVLDQDDLCYPERIVRQVEVSAMHPSADLVFADTHYIDEHGAVFGRHLARFDLPPELVKRGVVANMLLRHGCFVDSEAWFFRKRLFEALGPLDTRLRYACDYEYFIRAGLHTDFAYTPDVVGAWRIHPDQETRTARHRFSESRAVKRKFLSHPGIGAGVKLRMIAGLGKSYLNQLVG